jgi:hypothetical protein
MSISQALNQVHTIENLCNFLEHPAVLDLIKQIPVTMPPEIAAFGFDTPFWLGLGTVGLWAALDAYAERNLPEQRTRCKICRSICLEAKYKVTDPGLSIVLNELEDLRHLFAHNFAGQADAEYFKYKTRHVLTTAAPKVLSSDAQFTGHRITLEIPNLRYYCKRVVDILKAVA